MKSGFCALVVVFGLFWVGQGVVASHRHGPARSYSKKPVVFHPLALQPESAEQKAFKKESLGEFPKAIERAFSNRLLNKVQFGFIVTSLTSHEVLVEHDADTLLNPASNVKLVTTLAALSILKPDYRFKTEYYIDGDGDLIVKGYGDPSITNERLMHVARALELRGIKEIKGDIILDTTYFEDEGQAKGWSQERHNPKSYTAPIGALSLNSNTVNISIRSESPGVPASFELDPPSDYFKIKGQILTSERKNRPFVGIEDDGKTMEVKISGQVSQRVDYAEFRRKIFNPTYYFGNSLVYFLKQEGIHCESSQIRTGKLSPRAKLVWTDRSESLWQVASDTNKYSSNFMAEMLVKAIGAQTSVPARFETGLHSIRQFLENEVGLKKGSYRVENGSGLNDYNRFSARQMAQLLDYAYKNFEVASEFVSSLAVAGSQGTISKRMKNMPAERKLRAKTGTLTGVSSLSGYVVTKDNDVLAFSMIVQGRGCLPYKARQLEDSIGNALASIDIDTPTQLATTFEKNLEKNDTNKEEEGVEPAEQAVTEEEEISGGGG